jgi:osmotically inducible protein OsmC
MPKRKAEARWEGGLKDGRGMMKLGSGAYEGAYSFGSRFESAGGTNPEELIGAAHAGCFSMALSLMLEQAGFKPKRIDTRAEVTFEKVHDHFEITRIHLHCEAEVPGIDEATFREKATSAKNGCPVSRALTGTRIELETRLKT